MTKSAPTRQWLEVALERTQAATPTGSRVTDEVEGCLHAYQSELTYLIGSLRRLGVPSRDLEDALHEVFLVMLKRWDDYDRGRPLKPWLFGIAFRVASGQRRRSHRERHGSEHELEYDGDAPDQMLELSEARRLLMSALSSIPLERRAVLVMHEVDETPMRDIAEQLEIPLFTAYSRLRKARKELDAALIRLQKRGLA